nr:MAG TPA: hypothetical protein [Caudoviricetes sp.]
MSTYFSPLSDIFFLTMPELCVTMQIQFKKRM